jgi:hypothetical protein
MLGTGRESLYTCVLLGIGHLPLASSEASVLELVRGRLVANAAFLKPDATSDCRPAYGFSEARLPAPAYNKPAHRADNDQTDADQKPGLSVDPFARLFHNKPAEGFNRHCSQSQHDSDENYLSHLNLAGRRPASPV